MMPTGSAVERAMHCPTSCVLARAGHQGDGAVYGTEQHREIEEGDRSRPVVREVLDGATDVRHEVAFAIDVGTRTVRELGSSLGRSYGALGPKVIALTIDLICRKNGVVWVGDWKSRSRVSPVRENWQIRCAALAVMTAMRADNVVGFLGYLDDSELETCAFDAFDASTWWSELECLYADILLAQAEIERNETPEVSAGSWCQYCPALPHCPAHTRLALSMLGELDKVDASIDGLTVEQCGRAWELLKRYDVLADRVKESIRNRARREPVPLSNGRRLQLVESHRRSVDTKKVVEMLGDKTPYKTSHFTQVREGKMEASDG